MVITPHALMGAVCSRGEKTTLGAIAAAWQSHYLLDRIPHYDYSISGRNGQARLAFDAGLALFMLRGTTHREKIGALAGVMPDIVSVATQRGWITHTLLDALQNKHVANHTNRRPGPVAGSLTQVAVSGMLYVLLKDNKPS